MRLNWRILLAALALLGVLATACATEETAAEETDEAAADDEAPAATDETTTQDEAEEPAEELSGSIEIDGSSTVAPLTDAISEEYAAVQPDVIVNLGVSGTGGGFERFCAGETDISNASRPIKDEEAAACEAAGVTFTEVQVGVDALTMVTNPAADFLTCLTTDEIVALWGPDGAATWDQVNAEFPAEQVQIFAPGADSGTYDFMNETVLPDGVEGPRQDYNASEDDNVIAQGVEATSNSWGFFGYAYYVNEGDRLKAVEYDAGEGCVAPSAETAVDGSYGLTRPLFIYVKNESLANAHFAGYVQFYLETVNEVIEDVGYIPVPGEVITEGQTAIEAQL